MPGRVAAANVEKLFPFLGPSLHRRFAVAHRRDEAFGRIQFALHRLEALPANYSLFDRRLFTGDDDDIVRRVHTAVTEQPEASNQIEGGWRAQKDRPIDEGVDGRNPARGEQASAVIARASAVTIKNNCRPGRRSRPAHENVSEFELPGKF